MRESFLTLAAGLVLAIVLIYLLMVANFQSWLEPFIITMALPGALVGVLWMLIATGTTINVESLMGTIMAVGVGVANGNLLITFANELREEGRDPLAAAIEAGHIRFRPIIMTALAMILGMLPMALGLGAGGEQNAPLGRAVIGGLMLATVMTLFVVPAIYSIFTREFIGKHERDARINRVVPPTRFGRLDYGWKPNLPKKNFRREIRILPGMWPDGWWRCSAVLAATTAVVMARTHAVSAERSARTAVADKGPRVLVTRAGTAPAQRRLTLPATIQGYVETPVFAKIPGYLKEIRVDKGDRVRKGQVLAILESPELDAQVADARHSLWLQTITDQRNQGLVLKHGISQQIADNSHGAMLEASDTYNQLRALQAYEVITALFDGIVTARYVDPGALVAQTTTPTQSYLLSHTSENATPIVMLATLRPLRVYASAPQNIANFIYDGGPATISVEQRPGRDIAARVTRHPGRWIPSRA